MAISKPKTASSNSTARSTAVALTLEITPVGLALLESAVAYYLAWQRSALSDGLCGGHAGRILSRHRRAKSSASPTRIACCTNSSASNPLTVISASIATTRKTLVSDGDAWRSRPGRPTGTAARYPIDFFIVHEGRACTSCQPRRSADGKLPLAQLGTLARAHARWLDPARRLPLALLP